MSDDLMELKYSGSLITYILKRIQMTHFKQFSIVPASEDFSIRDVLYWKTHCVFPNVEGFF